MGRYLEDIKEKTSSMNPKERCAYILTYYWYHMLVGISVIALILLFGGHSIWGNQKPVFTCVMVNQKMNPARDQTMIDLFAKETGLSSEQIVIDSTYQFSYDNFKLEHVNESTYEKFFFQWDNQELDAVVLSEHFYKYCKKMGGKFRQMTEQETEGFAVYFDDGIASAIILGTDSFTEMVTGNKEETLLLAFPENGKHVRESKLFLKYLHENRETWEGERWFE